jgi:hypothetical protein
MQQITDQREKQIRENARQYHGGTGKIRPNPHKVSSIEALVWEDEINMLVLGAKK